MQSFTSAVNCWFHFLDQARRMRGASMDQMGYGPIESPYATVLTRPGMRLRFYGGMPASRRTALIIPAPIKRPYIWDLSPEYSVVQRALTAGMRVYLVEWTLPGAGQASFGLDQYASTLLDACIAAIHAAQRDSRLFLLSHSLGGILAAIYAALRPEQVAGMVLIESPLHFAEATGSFGPMLSLSPPAHEMTRLFENVPGSVISLASVTASPTTFQAERYADFVASMESDALLRKHMQVERWALDEAPMSGRLFEEIIDQLYREDRFMRGTLEVGGQRIGPADVVSPFLAVYDPRSLIMPPASIAVFHAATRSRNKRLLPYSGDRGTALAHVGALAGTNAHRHLWPMIFRWMEETGVDEPGATRH
ncbi:MAG TPA: alpha/beta fold hydrolase [Noviherbaspirillum sp.]|uniref:alpha/beta fold hydrolase n=1 Tax=Noviherbaspirillum sp. TaxID=1926288 RepID=UPI002B473EBB|nr:alpha/beta fold hydrolase [Noviherbaspirillum sp.]HJV85371.1 alpha/beta fold hydrolase [Noviherbaspirillum sp.]